MLFLTPLIWCTVHKAPSHSTEFTTKEPAENYTTWQHCLWVFFTRCLMTGTFVQRWYHEEKRFDSTNPVEARLAAELVSSGGAEVVIGTERFVQCGDEVEQSLPATLIAQRVLCFITALPQPERKRNSERSRSRQKIFFFFFFLNEETCHYRDAERSHQVAGQERHFLKKDPHYLKHVRD